MGLWDDLCRPPVQEGLSDAFSEAAISFLKLSVKEKFEPGRVRSSALPICGRNYSFGLVLPPDEKQIRSSDFLLNLQGEVGTVTHRVVQKWLGMSGILHGDWKCEKCKKVRRNHTGTPHCKRCGEPMVYEELELRHPHIGITGHPDGILKIGKKFIGFELKTKNQRVVDELTEPIDTHVLYQTACYALMLKLTRGIELTHYAIFYISRDSPWSYQIGYSPKRGKKADVIFRRGTGDHFLLKIFKFKIDTKPIRKELRYIDDVIKAQKKAGKKLLKRKQWGICEGPEDPRARYCPYKYVCWSKLAKSLE